MFLRTSNLVILFITSFVLHQHYINYPTLLDDLKCNQHAEYDNKDQQLLNPASYYQQETLR